MTAKQTGEQAIGDAAVRAATGRDWEAWFAILDAWGAAERGHPAIARHLQDAHGLGGWWAQTVTVRYEQARGLRVPGQRGNNDFELAVQRTLSVEAERAFAALTEPGELSHWFTRDAQADLRVGGRYRNADGDAGTFLVLDPPRRVVFTWEQPQHAPGSKVEMTVEPRDGGKVTVRIRHLGIPNAADHAKLKEAWGRAIESYKAYLLTGKGIPAGGA